MILIIILPLNYLLEFIYIFLYDIKLYFIFIIFSEAKLYIEENLITVGGGILENVARQNVSIIAYKILKEMCFTLIVT